MEKTGGRWICLGKGMVIAFAITCIIFIGFGILLTYTSISEDSLPLVSMVSAALSAAAAGYDWAMCMQKKGILWGIGAGAVYTVLLYLVTSLAGDSFSLTLSSVMTLLVALAGGAVGGILGVNRK
ncbi:MAG: TIGR04086 family membrane protein [Bacillota bacterium]|nr:TIGR04086 family membrane protein [Bacillota bacterium]